MVKFNRIRISNESTIRLKTLKSRTGLTPNILCRFALAFSLNQGSQKDGLIKVDEEGQEFNRYTLLGEHDTFFISLIKQRCIEDGLDPEKYFMKQFKLHINNGVMSIYSRVKNLSDLVNLLD